MISTIRKHVPYRKAIIKPQECNGYNIHSFGKVTKANFGVVTRQSPYMLVPEILEPIPGKLAPLCAWVGAAKKTLFTCTPDTHA